MAGPPKRKPIRTLRQTKNVCSPGIDSVKASVTYLGVANGKCETLRDGETSVFLCEPETF